MPFSTEQFFSIFENYNTTVFPLQWIFLFLGFTALFFATSKKPVKNNIIGSILVVTWIWTGIVYHIIFFASINPAAIAFGGLFILQGIFLYIETFVRKNLVFNYSGSVKDNLALFFLLFGLVIYPVISFYFEGSIIRTISFGLPCPTTIVTFGFLLLTDRKFSGYLLFIPSVWAIIGTAAAINFGVYQDYVMIFSAIVTNICLIRNRCKKH